MSDILFHAYLPLIGWTSLGLLAVRFLPQALPRFLGRALYWFGVPWEVFFLVRQTDFSQGIGLAPAMVLLTLGLGLGLGWLSLRLGAIGATDATGASALTAPQTGSFMIAAAIGNTSFVGLALVPTLISANYVGWAIFFSVAHNLMGPYVLGVLLASYYGRDFPGRTVWTLLKDVLTVPSLWAFGLSWLTRSRPFPASVELGLQASLWFVIPAAFLLMGMRLSQLAGLHSLKVAIRPTVIKMLALPLAVLAVTTAIGMTGEPRLALVLMAGMPSAFAGLILAEEYDLDRDVIASSIALSTVVLLGTIPLWLLWLG